MPVEKVAVIGSGLMGHGIAQVAAMSGQQVALIDIKQEFLDRATLKMGESLAKFAEKGRIKEKPEDVLKRIKTTTDLSKGVSDAGLIIEAVFEDINLKKKVMKDVDASAPRNAILATNSSGLSVTMIAEATRRKEKVIGMHWMNPPQIMKVVEIIKSKYTDEVTLQGTLDACRQYGKDTITAQRDVWFFLAARAHTGWSIEAGLMYLNKEADFKEIDATMRYKVGLPMGDFELTDFIGMADIRTKGFDSVVANILKVYPEFEPWPAFLTINQYVVDKLWRPMSEKGLSGIKTGKGYYDYPGGKYVKPEIPRELAEKVDAAQLLAPTINAAAWCVTNGVGSIEDVNKSFKMAYGWPKGIFEFISDYGIDKIISVVKEKQKKAIPPLRDFYKLDPLLANWKS
ncbi:MAG: 3-hydroxyacyl-CoA dehydrogenase NAD-binding domain-containing protein [Dehalococcoidales bacterium]|nr:3-hydroxyacyl-CoA dehydrogenase NAD-binding domain-containing protein [Dehalococcoidales bacterium]